MQCLRARLHYTLLIISIWNQDSNTDYTFLYPDEADNAKAKKAKFNVYFRITRIQREMAQLRVEPVASCLSGNCATD